MREKLIAGGLRDDVASERKELDDALAERESREHCGQADATPACKVTIRVIYQILRAFPPEQVFAQTVLGFEVASSDPRVVGINYVQPEDAYMAMSEYHRQMVWMDYLHGIYPKVHISLHAGRNWLRGSYLRMGCVFIFARRWSWGMRSGSAMGWT